MKDTVTYPLSAITGDEEESRIDQLEREIAKAIAAERERCARVCEEISNSMYWLNNRKEIAEDCAAAIRKGE